MIRNALTLAFRRQRKVGRQVALSGTGLDRSLPEAKLPHPREGVNFSQPRRYQFGAVQGPPAVQCLQQITHYGRTQTMTTKTLQALLIAALLSSVSAFADQAIEVSIVNGKQQAAFSVGDSKCVLVNDVIKCTPVILASN